jgi:hypothetical protein
VGVVGGYEIAIGRDVRSVFIQVEPTPVFGSLENVMLQKFGGSVGGGQQMTSAIVEDPSARFFFVFRLEIFEPSAALQKTDRPFFRPEIRARFDFAPEVILDSVRGIFAPAEGGVGCPTASKVGVKSTGSVFKSTRGVNSKQVLSLALPYSALAMFERDYVPRSFKNAFCHFTLILYIDRKGGLDPILGFTPTPPQKAENRRTISHRFDSLN